jgi:hypothetical protein
MAIRYKKKRPIDGVFSEPEEKVVTVPENIEDMTKLELDEYAHNHDGIELDRRKTKKNMIKEFLTKLKGEK